MASLTTIANDMPVRDQLALRLLGNMLMGGTAPDDPAAAVHKAYAYGDSFLDVARENWRAAQAAKQAEAADIESDDAQAPA